MAQADYYQNMQITGIYHDFWYTVHPRDLAKGGITIESFKDLDYYLQLFEYKTDGLPEKEKETFHKIKGLYEHKKRNSGQAYYENSYSYPQEQAQWDYSSTNGGGYYQGNYPQQQGNYPQQQGNYSQQQYYTQQQQYYYPQQNQHNQQTDQGSYYSNQQNYNTGLYDPQYYSGQQHMNYPQENYYGPKKTWEQRQNQSFQQTSYEGQPKQEKRKRDYVQKNIQSAEGFSSGIEYQMSPAAHAEFYKQDIGEEAAPFPESQQEPPKEPPKKIKFSVLEIRKMIKEAEKQKENIANIASQKLVQQVEDMKQWEKKEELAEIIQQDPTKMTRKTSKKPNSEFNKGRNYNPSREADINMGSNFGKAANPLVPDITIGKNESLETRLKKKDLREKAAKVNYALAKVEEENQMDDIEKSKRNIIYHLNLIAPENLKDIFKDLAPYCKKEKEICTALVILIIQKSWEQPKYASSYAKLCSYFTKVQEKQFSFSIEQQSQKKGNNPFKHLLIQKVQHSFDKKNIDVPKFEDDFQKQMFLKDTKKNMLGNVKFIAELIKSKVIRKKTIKYCISRLIYDFLNEHYLFVKEGKFQNSFYDFQFQTLIQFLENLGEKYESIDDDDKDEESKYGEAEQKVKSICEGAEPRQIPELANLKADEYFKIFFIIDKYILSKKKGRVSALLKNLQERRDNKWKKHHVEAEGPKKLKDLKPDEDNQVGYKSKTDFAKLDESMTKMLKKVQEEDDVWKKELQKLAKEYEPEQFLTSYLKIMPEEKKQFVQKRLIIFDDIIDKYFQRTGFKKAWENAIRNLALLSSDIPFCGAALAKALARVDEKKQVNFDEFFLKFDEDVEEDEFYFMEQIYQKLYHYTQKEELKKHIKPKAKLSHLL